MASVIYKEIDGVITSKTVEIAFLAQELEFGGWSTSPDCKQVVTKAEADTNNTGKLSNNEIREAAKKANIVGYKRKSIKTLEAELWPNSK